MRLVPDEAHIPSVIAPDPPVIAPDPLVVALDPTIVAPDSPVDFSVQPPNILDPFPSSPFNEQVEDEQVEDELPSLSLQSAIKGQWKPHDRCEARAV